MTGKFGMVCFGRKSVMNEILKPDSGQTPARTEQDEPPRRIRFGQTVTTQKRDFTLETGTSRLRKRLNCMKLQRRQRRKGWFHDQFWIS
jgi:hypothetical protein